MLCSGLNSDNRKNKTKGFFAFFGLWTNKKIYSRITFTDILFEYVSHNK